MRRLRAVSGAALLVGGALLGLTPSPADATSLTQAGWWWRVNDGTLPAALPAPPTVPEGGLMVAGAPDGATAIAALHFELEEGEGAPVLTLQVAENGDQGGEQAVLAACLTGSAWQPEQAGSWLNKPFPACDQASVTGVRADDGTTWTFAVAPLLSDGIVDLILVPGVDPQLPAGANGSTFQVVFEAPTAASLATSSGAGPSPTLDLDPSGFAPTAPADSFAAPAFAGGDLSLPPVAPASSFTPSLPEADQGLTATAPVVQERAAPLPVSPIAAVEDHRVLGMVILALCGAALLWSAQLPTPALRRLGGVAGGSTAVEASIPDPAASPLPAAGLGRFARTRTGPPPRL